MVEQVGRVIDARYRLIAPLGAGASSQVFLADDVRLRRRVAVKVLHPALAGDPTFLRRFQAEAQAAGAMTHPHVNAVYDWGDDGGRPYLVLEYLAGGSLRSLLDSGEQLDVAQAARVMREAAEGLAFAHSRGFVHRDIKPANLLFDAEGRTRVADFGLARALAEAAHTEPDGAVVGTARYAAPEQARGDRAEGKADLYSLALTIVEAVTGEVPFASDTPIAALMARAETPLDVPDRLGELAPLLRRLGGVDPADRPDAIEVVAELEHLCRDLGPARPLSLAGAFPRGDGEPVEPADPTVLPADGPPADIDEVPQADPADPSAGPEPQPRRMRRRVFVAAAFALALAAGIGGTVFFQRVTLPEHEVPALVGLSQSEARAEALDLGFEVRVTEVFADDTMPGEVLSQSPPEGDLLREGETVGLVVSLGPEPVPVPEVVGLMLDEARRALEAAELAVGEVERVFDEEAPEGEVLLAAAGGNPIVPAETEVPRGSGVDLIVSEGPRPRTIPDVAGRSFDDAQAALDDVDLVANQTEAFSDDVAAGLVIGTSPAVGAEVPKGSTVDVIVSKGPEIIDVPDVAGRTTSDAARVLTEAGLEVQGVEGNPNKPVKGTDPKAGSQVRRGTGVTIIT